MGFMGRGPRAWPGRRGAPFPSNLGPSASGFPGFRPVRVSQLALLGQSASSFTYAPAHYPCDGGVWNVVVVLKEEREGGGEWFRAMTHTVRRVSGTGPRPTRVLSLCAKLRRAHHPSPQVF